MKNLTPEIITKVCNGRYFGSDSVSDVEIAEITTDSRNVVLNGLFVAIKGERVDGNKFVKQTYENGAVCCISEDETENIPEGKAYIVVESCFQALKDIAEYYRQVCGTKIVGITGSVGKTTTKEMIAAVLSEKFNVLKTQGNFNNEVGVPLTIFRLRPEHEVAIVEMGISDFGEMTRLSKIAKPDCCVITNIGQCHLENLGDRDGVLRAKTEIFTSMSEDGTVYLNGDDDKLITVDAVNGSKPVFFGMDSVNEVYAENIVSRGLAGTDLDVVRGDIRFAVHVPVPGKHMVTNALAAVAIGLDMGMTAEKISAGIKKFVPVGGHSSIVETEKFTIMDDCYNANPVSMKAGIDVLSEVESRKVAIIGDMFELGTDERELHFGVGEYAAQKGIDCVICVGTLAKEYESAIKKTDKNIDIHYFEELENALEEIKNLVKDGDSILVKASHSMHFEKIVAVLKDM